MSKRPAKHSKGDRSSVLLRLAPKSLVIGLFGAISGSESPLTRRIRTPGQLQRLRRPHTHEQRARTPQARWKRPRPHHRRRSRERRDGATPFGLRTATNSSAATPRRRATAWRTYRPTPSRRDNPFRARSPDATRSRSTPQSQAATRSTVHAPRGAPRAELFGGTRRTGPHATLRTAPRRPRGQHARRGGCQDELLSARNPKHSERAGVRRARGHRTALEFRQSSELLAPAWRPWRVRAPCGRGRRRRATGGGGAGAPSFGSTTSH